MAHAAKTIIRFASGYCCKLVKQDLSEKSRFSRMALLRIPAAQGSAFERHNHEFGPDDCAILCSPLQGGILKHGNAWIVPKGRSDDLSHCGSGLSKFCCRRSAQGRALIANTRPHPLSIDSTESIGKVQRRRKTTRITGFKLKRNRKGINIH